MKSKDGHDEFKAIGCGPQQEVYLELSVEDLVERQTLEQRQSKKKFEAFWNLDLNSLLANAGKKQENF